MLIAIHHEPFMLHFRLIRLQAAAQICDDFFAEKVLKEFSGRDFDESIVSVIKEIAQECDETLVICRMLTKDSTCEKYFQDVLTEEGICFTFNLLGASDVATDK